MPKRRPVFHRSPAVDPRIDALDRLTDQFQRLYVIYDARRASAETKAAGILTAAVAIAALTATASGLVNNVDSTFAIGLVVLLLFSVAAAIYAASGAGLVGRRSRSRRADMGSPFLSIESAEYRAAADALRVAAGKLLASCERSNNEAIAVRVVALRLWQERELDAHRLARDKDRGVAAAGILLGLALVCGAVVVVKIVAS